MSERGKRRDDDDVVDTPLDAHTHAHARRRERKKRDRHTRTDRALATVRPLSLSLSLSPVIERAERERENEVCALRALKEMRPFSPSALFSLSSIAVSSSHLFFFSRSATEKRGGRKRQFRALQFFMHFMQEDARATAKK